MASSGVIDNTVFVSWEPIDEMRTVLNQAIGPPANGYAAGLAQNQPVLAIHIQELRDRVKNNWNVAVSIRRSEVEAVIPKDWVKSATKTGGGTRHLDPINRGDGVRLMPGNPAAPDLIKQGPYASVTKSGIKTRIPLEGNPTLP